MIFVKLNIQRFAESKIVIETRVDNSKLKEDLKKAEDYLEFWTKRKEEYINKGTDDKEWLDNANDSIDFWKSRIKKLKEQLSGESIIPKTPTEEIKQASNMLDTIGNKLTNTLSNIAGKILGIGRTGVTVIKTLVKTLATSGILLIIMSILLTVKLIADAFKRVTDQNEELKNKIEYLKFVLKTMYDNILKPIVDELDSVGVIESEQHMGGMGVQYESEVIYHSMLEEIEKKKVIFTSIENAMKNYPDLVKKYFGKIVSNSDNKFAALNSAVFSGGSFIYIPKNTKLDRPLQSYFRINSRNMGQFERTLIIVDDNSELDLAEATILVGIPKSPSNYSPIKNTENAKERPAHWNRYHGALCVGYHHYAQGYYYPSRLRAWSHEGSR